MTPTTYRVTAWLIGSTGGIIDRKTASNLTDAQSRETMRNIRALGPSWEVRRDVE